MGECSDVMHHKGSQSDTFSLFFPVSQHNLAERAVLVDKITVSSNPGGTVAFRNDRNEWGKEENVFGFGCKTIQLCAYIVEHLDCSQKQSH